MNAADQVDARLRALEERVASLEAAVPAQSLTMNDSAAVAKPILAPLPPTPPAPPRPAPAPAPAPVAAPTAGASWSAVIADLEEKLTGRALAVVGGVALVVGAIFFLSLAFSRGWIGPEGRVLIGVGASGIALALGAWQLDQRQPTIGGVLVAVGLSVVSLAMFAATRLYGLVPVEIGLLMTL